MKTTHSNIISNIDIHHIEFVRLRIGFLNECDFSIRLHYNELKNLGETDFRLSLVSVWNKAPYFSEKECALFTLTDYVISSNTDENFEHVRTLLEPYFTQGQIVDLTYAIKQIDIWTRSLKSTERSGLSKK